MNRSLRGWVTLLALIGLVAAVSSTYIHLQLVADPTYSSFCDVNQTVSCTQLYQSRYGSVLGIPVALGGVFWFGVVLLLVFADLRGPVGSRENIASYFLVWTTVGVRLHFCFGGVLYPLWCCLYRSWRYLFDDWIRGSDASASISVSFGWRPESARSSASWTDLDLIVHGGFVGFRSLVFRNELECPD